MTDVLAAMATMGAVVALGWFVGARGALGPHARTVLAATCFTVATPCLLFATLATADLGLLWSRAAATTATATLAVALGMLVVCRWWWRRDAGTAAITTLSASYVNAGNLGIPLAVYLFGDPLAVVPTMLVQLLLLGPPAVAALESAFPGTTRSPRPAMAPGARARAARRVVTNPLLLGTLAGMAAAALPWPVPDVVLGPFALLGAAAPPLALLTFGMALATPADAGGGDGRGGGAWTTGTEGGSTPGREHAARLPVRDLVTVVLVRTLVHPALAWALGTALGLPAETLFVVVAMACLPTAQNVVVYAARYGTAVDLAARACLVTTATSVPLLLAVTLVLGG